MVDGRGLSSLLALCYVGSVYIFPGARESFRNDSGVLWRRILGVIIFTAIAIYSYPQDLSSWAGFHGKATSRPAMKAIVAIHLLYIAPLLAFGYPNFEIPRTFDARLRYARDYIVGPISEELIYRGTILDIYKASGLSQRSALSENFLYFGFAHLHHGIMAWLGDETTFKRAMKASLAQFVMTSLFGTYACYLMLQTGSVWPSIATHILCNFFGPPQLSGGPSWYFPGLVLGLALWVYAVTYI